VYGRWPVLRSTIVGCFGPIAGPSLEALAVVRPLVPVGRLELVPGHRAVAVGSHDLVAGSLDPEEDILDPVEDIAVVGEGDHLQGCLDHRTSPTPHARQVHRGMSLWVVLELILTTGHNEGWSLLTFRLLLGLLVIVVEKLLHLLLEEVHDQLLFL
jgi:hypothetical protein